jgi:hypothetical protein
VSWIHLPHSRFQCWILAACFMLVSCVTYSSTVKTEAICSFETSVHFHRSVRSYIADDTTLHNTEVLQTYCKFSPSFVEKLEVWTKVENSEECTPYRNKMKWIICTNILWQIWRYFKYERCYTTAGYGFRRFLRNDFPNTRDREI